jgi:chromate transporter
MAEKITVLGIFRYFLYIGASGFGGPLAIIEYMRRDLVMKKKWMTLEEFREYFGYAQIAPGPLAFQVGLYFSYFKKGFWAAVLSGVGLVLPSYIVVLIFSVFYKEFKDIQYIVWALYGISPVIVAIIFFSGFNLSKSVFSKEVIQYILFFGSVFLTIFFRTTIIYLIIGSALVSLIYFTVKDKLIFRNKSGGLDLAGVAMMLTFIATELFSAAQGKILLMFNNVKDSVSAKLIEMSLLFLKVGALTYGSGFVIVGVLRQEVVDRLGWLTPKEFLDGIAFGQITPGPVVITSTFIGYMTNGFAGSLLATVCIFLPSFIMCMILAQRIQKIRDNFYLKALIKGANAAAIGAILSTAFFLSKDAIVDYYTAGLFLIGLAVLFFTKVKPYYIIAASAGAGILLKLYL